MEWKKVMENDEWGWGSVRGIGDRVLFAAERSMAGAMEMRGWMGMMGKAVEWLGDGGIWGRGIKGSKGKQWSGE